MKARTFAEVGLALVAVYALAQGITLVASAFWVVGASVTHFSGFEDFLGILLMLLTVGLPLVFAYVLIRFRHRIAVRLVPDDETAPEGARGAPGEALFYRLAFIVAGALVLGLAIPRATGGLMVFVMQARTHGIERAPEHINRIIREGGWRTLLTFALQVALALYLLFGAPGLARWHMRKSAEGNAKAAQA